MMKNLKRIIWIILPAILMLGCQQETFELTETPVEEADATFTVTESTEAANTYIFSNDAEGFIKDWNFGNGTGMKGDEVTAYFPFEGEYEVTLTVFNKGGSVSSSQTIVIDETDPEICNVETLQLLTGGCDSPDGKTWVFDGERAGYFGVGPNYNFFPEFYSAQPGEQDVTAFIDDEYTFKLINSVFEMHTNGDVEVRSGAESGFAGAVPNNGNFSAPFEGPEGLTYSITSNEAGDDFINISPPGFIGFYTGSRSYQILELTENVLYLRYADNVDPFLVWYQKFIRKGYAPLEVGFSFEATGLEVAFTNSSLNADTYSWDFGDSNTSTEENPTHTYATGGTYTVTLTVTQGSTELVETQEITVSDAPEVLETVLTEALLNGDNEKTWVLKSEAGSWGVGSFPGGVDYFSVGPADRPCVYDDEYTFRTGGQYEYNASGTIWGDDYFVGLSAACIDESDLNGTDAEAWASGFHSYSFKPATETDPAKITVRGTGAFIGLTKAYNGGEYSSAPPPTNVAVTYDVVEYEKNTLEEKLTLTIDVGGAFWSFYLVAQ